ncbi:MAG: nucleoside triphosphate pyrophosphohydrolase [Dehalococcoidales bacterium]|nr:nucleoside triphosphate pyrophosphohydrolase [Dehalococcoidales bacterium]
MAIPKDLSKFAALVKIVADLRAPDGCPWDKEQTHKSLREDFLQECYEVIEALDEADALKLKEELGDLLLHIVLQAQIAAEAGEFALADVLTNINKKLIHRHPHVFGDTIVHGVEEIKYNWQALKKIEKGAGKSIIASVPKSMPALSYAEEIQNRVAAVGFDWDDDSGVIDKLAEEVAEFNRAANQAEKTDEYGDLLFTLVNIARRQGIDVEVALREANRKFTQRFQYMEKICHQKQQDIGKLSFKEQNALWDEAKSRVG